MMKKIKGCVPILISAVLLSSCVKNDIKMTDEQIDRTAEYAAGILLKYDKNYERESCTPDVSGTSGIKERTVGRASVESVLLCHNGQ